MNDENNKLSIHILSLCFKIPASGIEVFWPQNQHVEKFSPEFGENDKMTYCQNNGRLAFVDENGDFYVTPYCLEVRAALNEADYKKRDLYVPFSNGDYPYDINSRAQWDILSNGAIQAFKKFQRDERIARFKMEAEKRKIQELPQDLYDMCIEIPKEGMDVKYFWKEEPSHLNGLEDSQAIEWMGSYSINNGILTFVDGEGRWFVTPSAREAAHILDECGYKNEGMNHYVPFSNGDEPAVYPQSIKWKEFISNKNQGSGPKF